MASGKRLEDKSDMENDISDVENVRVLTCMHFNEEKIRVMGISMRLFVRRKKIWNKQVIYTCLRFFMTPLV